MAIIKMLQHVRANTLEMNRKLESLSKEQIQRRAKWNFQK